MTRTGKIQMCLHCHVCSPRVWNAPNLTIVHFQPDAKTILLAPLTFILSPLRWGEDNFLGVVGQPVFLSLGAREQ